MRSVACSEVPTCSLSVRGSQLACQASVGRRHRLFSQAQTGANDPLGDCCAVWAAEPSAVPTGFEMQAVCRGSSSAAFQWARHASTARTAWPPPRLRGEETSRTICAACASCSDEFTSHYGPGRCVQALSRPPLQGSAWLRRRTGVISVEDPRRSCSAA
jgi:hypothetical protein